MAKTTRNTVQQKIDSGANLGGFAWGQVNHAAAKWATEHAGETLEDVNAMTLAQIRTAIAAFHATPGMTRGDLERLILEGPSGVQDLTLADGRILTAAERADMIAVTEVTRSYTEGALVAMRATGLDMVEPDADKTPPLHPRCRCDLSAFTRDDGVTSWHFNTNNDDLVCEICAPLHGKDIGEGSPDFAQHEPVAERQREPDQQQVLASSPYQKQASNTIMGKVRRWLGSDKTT